MKCVHPMSLNDAQDSKELFYDDLLIFFIDNCGKEIKDELLETWTEEEIELEEIEDALLKNANSYKEFVDKFNADSSFKMDLIDKVYEKSIIIDDCDKWFDPYFIINIFINYQVKFISDSIPYDKLKQMLTYSKMLKIADINNDYNISDYENSKKKDIADLDEIKWYKYFIYDYFDAIFSSNPNTKENIDKHDYEYFEKYFDYITERKGIIKKLNEEFEENKRNDNLKINNFIINKYINKIIENIESNYNLAYTSDGVTYKLSSLYIFEDLELSSDLYKGIKFSKKLMDEVIKSFNSSIFSISNNIKLEYTKLDEDLKKEFYAVFYPHKCY